MKTTNQDYELTLLLAWSEAKFAGFLGLAAAYADELHRLHWGCPRVKAVGVQCDLPIYFERMEGFKHIMESMGIHRYEVDWQNVSDVCEFVASPA